MSPQLWDFRTNSTSSAETADAAVLQAMEGLTPTPASTPHQSPCNAPLGLPGGQSATAQSAPRPPVFSQHPTQQRGALPPPSSLALDGDAGAKKAAVRPRELRITATSGIGTLLEAINVLGAFLRHRHSLIVSWHRKLPVGSRQLTICMLLGFVGR